MVRRSTLDRSPHPDMCGGGSDVRVRLPERIELGSRQSKEARAGPRKVWPHRGNGGAVDRASPRHAATHSKDAGSAYV
jgi:hypothetical protein